MNAASMRRALLAVLLAGLAAPAFALDYQIHGFAAQGLVASEGNDYYGDSTNTSLDYYEAGLNGSANLGYGLLLAAQGMVRDAGATDNGELRLDYALLDYGFNLTPTAIAGLRAGRVKNAFGFYNDTRDIVFTRPGILMPLLYSDAIGIRSLLFSSDGGEVYARASLGTHELSASAGVARDRDLSRIEKRQLAGNRAFDTPEVRVDELRIARLQDEWDGGRYRLALSYIGGDLDVADPQQLLSGVFGLKLYVLSLAYRGERLGLTAEYAQTHTHSRFPNLGRDMTLIGDGLYVQADWRLTPDWQLYLRQDTIFADRSDRDGRHAAARLGVDRHARFTYDSVLGVHWRYGAHWGVWLEGHLIDGTSTVSTVDNFGQVRDPHWSLWTAMVAYQF